MTKKQFKVNEFLDYTRFIVKNYYGENQSSYSTQLKDAFLYARQCADYVCGRVLAERDLPDGQRERKIAYVSDGFNKIEKRREEAKKKRQKSNG